MVHVQSVRTLLLTQGYEPIQIISWQRAITLIALDKVEVVEEYDQPLLRAQSVVVNVPAVVRLRKTFRRHAKPVKFSRVNIYARDNYRCQYCALKCTPDDHQCHKTLGIFALKDGRVTGVGKTTPSR